MDVSRNPLVRQAEEAKRPSSWWLAWIVTVVLIVGGGIIGVLLATPIFGSDPAWPLYQYGELFVFGITLLGLYLWVRLKEKRSLLSVGFRGGDGWRKFAIGIAIGAAMMTLPVLFLLAIGVYETGASEHAISGLSALLPILPLLIVFAIQGTTEEAVTRGYMLQMGARQLPGWVAILGSSALFAVVHMSFDPFILSFLLLYAVFACIVALQQGSLWLISGIHAGWNFFQGNVYGLPVSGHPAATSLFSIGPAAGSPELVSGGNFGVEGSLIGAAVLIVSLVIAWRALRQSRAGGAM